MTDGPLTEQAPPATTTTIRTGTGWLRQPPRQALAVVGVAALLLVVAVYPLVITNPTATNFGVITLIFVAVASAWNIFSGYSGYLSLGHAIFYGAGAYFLVVAAKDWKLTGSAVFWLVPLAGLVAAVIAMPLGLVALRVRRHTFVVITIAFFFIAQLSASNLGVTGGSSGLLVPSPGNWAPATYNNPFYYLAMLLATATVVLSWQIRRSRFGLQLRAIRDDEDRAAGLGVRAMPVKLTALVLSAFITGMAGALWVYFIGEAFPQFVFDPLFDLAVVLMAFFGGLGTLAGPVLGALILEPTQLYLNLQQSNGYESEILFGALFLLVILFLPRGALPTASEYLTKGRARFRRGRADAP
ncbi:MAG TPA: branched-chain amino acid ABC transporter permease [Streptosporangiaceae bacterium]|jgi:branched-chain amino acid transport system permease protein|nr:branched-chain amino acid ABC transporter permease [Streptosporangiaceae bacterium]